MKKESILIIFLLIYMVVYGSINIYFFLKAKSAFNLNLKLSITLFLFLAFTVASPILVHLFEKNELYFPAKILAYAGYTWMGLIFLFFSISLFLELFNRIMPGNPLLIKYSFVIPLIISIGISIYGYFEAKNIRVEKIIIKTPKIKKDTGAIKIVQISDIHLGLLVGEEKLKIVAKMVKNINPDLLVSTGDLVDASFFDLEKCAIYLAEIKPAYGSFAVMGNHEYYANTDKAICFTEKAGFLLLRNTSIKICDFINIIGIDDPASKFNNINYKENEYNLLSNLPHNDFSLLLKHRPVVETQSRGLFDLQLSGHTHKGQIFPFSLLTRLFYRYNSGLGNISGNSFIYTSRGTGTWGPLIRFLAPPEITVIELIGMEN